MIITMSYLNNLFIDSTIDKYLHLQVGYTLFQCTQICKNHYTNTDNRDYLAPGYK